MKPTTRILLLALCALPSIANAGTIELTDIGATINFGANDQQRIDMRNYGAATIYGYFAGSVGSIRVGLYESVDGVTWVPLHRTAVTDSTQTLTVTGGTLKLQVAVKLFTDAIWNSNTVRTDQNLNITRLKVVITNLSGSVNMTTNKWYLTYTSS